MAVAAVMRSDRAGAERQVLEVVGALVAELGGPPARTAIKLDDSLDRDLGIGSLERVELLVRLQHVFGIRLPDTVMADAGTPRDLADAILAAEPSRPEAMPLPRPLSGPGVPASAAARTLSEVLAWHAEMTPERIHIFLRTEDGQEQPISYGSLWERASAIAGGLRTRGFGPGEAVALMLRSEEAFFHSFFGVLLAGGVPVPIYPPFRRDRIEEYAHRQVDILKSPVIPVTLRGTRHILPADDWLPRPGPVTVAVSPPVKSFGRAWTDIVKLRDEVRDEIARRSGERLVGTRTGSSPASSRA